MGVYVRYLHAYPSLGSVEVLDGNIPVVRRLEYGQVTPYFFAEAPERFRLETEDGSRSWGKEMPENGGAITWVLTEKEGSPWMVPIQDMERNAEEEEAVLRLVNLAVPVLDLYMGRIPEEMEVFLEQVEEGEANRVMDSMNGFEVDGRRISVEPAQAKGEGGKGSRGSRGGSRSGNGFRDRRDSGRGGRDSRRESDRGGRRSSRSDDKPKRKFYDDAPRSRKKRK